LLLEMNSCESSQTTSLINVQYQYFFVTDNIANGSVRIAHFPTETRQAVLFLYRIQIMLLLALQKKASITV